MQQGKETMGAHFIILHTSGMIAHCAMCSRFDAPIAERITTGKTICFTGTVWSVGMSHPYLPNCYANLFKLRSFHQQVTEISIPMLAVDFVPCASQGQQARNAIEHGTARCTARNTRSARESCQELGDHCLVHRCAYLAHGTQEHFVRTVQLSRRKLVLLARDAYVCGDLLDHIPDRQTKQKKKRKKM